MAPIATYVFIEVSASGLPEEDPNITSISMVALESAIFRKISERNRNSQSMKILHPGCPDSHVRTLEQHDFNVMYDMTDFIGRFEEPVCLIAYAGFKYGFKLLKQEYQDGLLSLPEGILCADSMAAFYDILEPENGKRTQAERLAGEDPWPPSQINRNSYELERVFEREIDGVNVESISHGYKRISAVLKIATKLSHDFLDWVDSNHSSFADVPVLHVR